MPISCNGSGLYQARNKRQEIESEKGKSVASKRLNHGKELMIRRVFFVTRLFGYFFGNEKSNKAKPPHGNELFPHPLFKRSDFFPADKSFLVNSWFKI